MTRKKKPATKSPVFASRPAAKGMAVSFTIRDQEHTLEAVEGPDGWSITPADEEEERALAGLSDEALNPPPAEPAADEEEDREVSTGNDDDAGEPGEGGLA